MDNLSNIKATLLLADGTVFTGFSCGKVGTTVGEICFTTGMTGYQELFTDHGPIEMMSMITRSDAGMNESDLDFKMIK